MLTVKTLDVQHFGELYFRWYYVRIMSRKLLNCRCTQIQMHFVTWRLNFHRIILPSFFPLVEQIISQSHQLPEDSLTKLAQQEVRSKRLKEVEHRAERIKEMALRKTQRALNLATEKGSSAWLTVLPLQDLGFNLNIRGSSVTLLNYATTGQQKISPPHVLVLAFTVKQKIKQSSGCEVRYPRAWFLGTTSISLLRCEGLSPWCCIV